MTATLSFSEVRFDPEETANINAKKQDNTKHNSLFKVHLCCVCVHARAHSRACEAGKKKTLLNSMTHTKGNCFNKTFSFVFLNT